MLKCPGQAQGVICRLGGENRRACRVKLRCSASKAGHSATMRLAPSSLGSLVRGLLHRSMVLAAALVALPHQVSHHSHSCP